MAVKARDLRDNIKSYGFEKGVVATLELLLEEHSALRVSMRDAIEMIDRLVDSLDKLHIIASGLKDGIDSLRRGMEEPHDS